MRNRIIVVGLALLLLTIPQPLFATPLAQAPQVVRLSQVDISAYPRVTLYVNVVDATGQVIEGLQDGLLTAPAPVKPSRQGPVLVLAIGGLWVLIVVAVLLALVGVA